MELIDTPFFLNEKKKHIQKSLAFGGVNVVSMQLRPGEIIAEHEADADVLIIVKAGKVAFTVAGERMEITSQNILHMDPGERHSLEALEASDFIVMQIKRS